MNEKKSSVLSRKERERLMRRREIMAAAQKVFAEKGYDNATLDEIAERAEFGKGTIYNYFRNKEDLFMNMLENEITITRNIIQEIISNGKSTYEQFVDVTERLFGLFYEKEDFFRVLVRVQGRIALRLSENMTQRLISHSDELDDLLAMSLEAGIQRGEIRPLNSKKAAHIFIHLVISTFMHYFCIDKKFDIEEDKNFLVTLFFDGIRMNSQNTVTE